MLRSCLLLAVVSTSVLATSPSFAQRQTQGMQYQQTQGTPEDQKACSKDATRFCRQVLGDDMQVLACFQQNRPKLSRSCQAVLQKYGQ